MSGIYRSAAGAQAVAERTRQFLAHWPVPNEHHHLPTCEGDTFVVACGSKAAPPLLLLHGSGANVTTWMGDVPVWSRHYRVYAVDMIGEPGLSAPSRPPMGSDAYARWLDEVLQALGVDRVSIVGISLGGWLALDYATRRPDRVDRLALLCPAGIGRQKWGVLVAALLLMPFGRRGISAAMRLVLGATPPDTPEARAFADYMVLINKHFKPRKALRMFDDSALTRLSMPVLAIVGSRDRLIDSRGTQRRLSRVAGQATVAVVPDAGHLLLGQTMPILEFLRGCPAAMNLEPESFQP